MKLTVCLCVVAYSFSFLVFGLQVNLLGPTASAVAQRVGVIESDLGLIFTVNGLSSIVGALPSGWLIDKLPGHAVLAAALAFQALGFAFIPFATSFAALATAFGFVALSWNIVNTAGNTFILWIGNAQAEDNPQAQAFLINMVNALFGAGSLAAPLMAELCATGLSNAMSVYWISALMTAVSAATFLVLPSPRPPGSAGSSSAGAAAAADNQHLQQQQQLSQAAGAEGYMLEWNTEGALVPAVAADADSSDRQPAAAWWHGGPLMLLLMVIALFNFLNVGTEVAFGGWIFTYSVKQVGLSTHEGHFLNASYWAAFTLGRVVASFAAVYLKPATLLFLSLPLAMLGSVIALLSPAAWMTGWLLLSVTVLVGLGASAGFANALAILDSFEPCTGSITGLLGGVAGAGCMTVPLVIALLAKHTSLGYQGLMVCSLVSFGIQIGCVPVALLVGGWLEASREIEELQSVTKEVMPEEQQPLLGSEC